MKSFFQDAPSLFGSFDSMDSWIYGSAQTLLNKSECTCIFLQIFLVVFLMSFCPLFIFILLVWWFWKSILLVHSDLLKLSRDDAAEKADAKIYRSLVGSLIYLTNTRPDIVQAVSMISRFLNDPSKLHFAAAKRIMRYLKGTQKMGIKYVKEAEWKLIGYTDSDWGGSIDDRKSTSGYLFSLGTNVISWSSKKQKSVALSSAEAEYIAASDATCEGIWLRRLLADLQQVQEEPTTIYCDNMSAIAMTKNPVFHSKTKHIELRHHFIRDMASKGEIILEFVGTTEQYADFLTKAVPVEKFEKSRDMLKIAN